MPRAIKRIRNDVKRTGPRTRPRRYLLARLRTQPDSDGKVITGVVGGARYVIIKGRGNTWQLYVETSGSR